MLLVERGGEVEGDDGDDDDGDDDDEEGEEATPSSIRSRSVTSHHGPIVLTLRSMPRSAASLCTSAKVSKGAGGGGGGGGGGEKEEGEEEETAGSASLADLLLRWCGRLRGKGGFIRSADSDREACSGSESSPRCGDGGSARCLIALSKVFFLQASKSFSPFSCYFNVFLSPYRPQLKKKKVRLSLPSLPPSLSPPLSLSHPKNISKLPVRVAQRPRDHARGRALPRGHYCGRHSGSGSSARIRRRRRRRRRRCRCGSPCFLVR